MSAYVRSVPPMARTTALPTSSAINTVSAVAAASAHWADVRAVVSKIAWRGGRWTAAICRVTTPTSAHSSRWLARL